MGCPRPRLKVRDGTREVIHFWSLNEMEATRRHGTSASLDFKRFLGVHQSGCQTAPARAGSAAMPPIPRYGTSRRWNDLNTPGIRPDAITGLPRSAPLPV